MTGVKISVVIPVKNGAKTIQKCLQGVLNQTLADQLEVIVVDSGSEDGTIEILKEFPVRLKQIHPDQFNHGTTRNLGAQMATGEYIVMTVQDAIPVDNLWLEKMIRHFNDPEVAGVCGQQIVPHEPDKNPHEWFRPVNFPSKRSYQFKSKTEFEELPAKERRSVCGWDDVNACYRAKVLKEILPFSEVEFGEDLDWACRAYLKGFKLIIDSNCRVKHYHHSDYRTHYNRIMKELKMDYNYFGIQPTAVFPLTKFFKIIYRNFKYSVSPYWIIYNWRLILAEWQARRVITKQINECLYKK